MDLIIDDPIVFFGTGPVAAKSLDRLSQKFNIELVITKSKHKHHKYPAPVEELSEKKGYKICFVESPKELEGKITSLRPKSELGVVIDFGIIIPPTVINYFKYGIINSHFSLLPKWRGADPITYAILKGDKQTGVSLMKIVDKLDEGPLLAQKRLEIGSKDNQITLTENLIGMSNDMLAEYLPKYISGHIKPRPQADKNVSYSKKISKKDGIINFDKTAKEIEQEIRAYAGWPKSRTTINDIDCIITNVEVKEEQIDQGKAIVRKNLLLIGCSKGSLVIKRLQPAGRKPMPADEFIRGYLRNNIY